MTQFGECAVFYFKYQPEMLRLYWEQQSTGEPADDDDVKKMARAVGNQCCEEIGIFLAECGKIIEFRFQGIGVQFEQHKLTSVKKEWSVSYGIAPRGRYRPWKMEVGVDIPTEKAEIIPWIWGEGKTQAEERLTNRLAMLSIPHRGRSNWGPAQSH